MGRGIVIAGPTAVGKTKLSLKLAKVLNAEIISADSAQIYRGLDIGTAKPSASEQEGILHHMIDVVEPTVKYNVGEYAKAVNTLLFQKEAEQKTIILVGGTGLYLKAITDGLSILPPGNSELRIKFSEKTTKELYSLLGKYDPEAAHFIHSNNRKRIERALEVLELSGQKFSILSRQNRKNNNYSFVKIAIGRNRAELYERIHIRVLEMMEAGFVQEVKKIEEKYPQSIRKLNIIGYNDILDYLEGMISLELAIERIQKNSRHYAKRQFTWFKNDHTYFWYDIGRQTEAEIIEDILKYKMYT
jgi:tRNA dimethylallyltransferase